MDSTMLDTHLENLDRRLTRVEQILPTLATKEDLRTLATKEELREAVAPLATRDEMRELRRHMDVIAESLHSDIKLLAEHLASEMSKRLGP